eukprot:GGOE01056976.1.p1 GENE.GGOE01056976.1~~GGOE01056976.1.p1  ORF type:complete len:863 (+),score=222.16 GGOE01056976.1:95-2683(+)
MDEDLYLLGLEAQIKALKEQHATMFGAFPRVDSPTVLYSTEAAPTAVTVLPTQPSSSPRRVVVHNDLPARLQYHSGMLMHHLLQATQPTPVETPATTAVTVPLQASPTAAECPVREVNGMENISRNKSRHRQLGKHRGDLAREVPSPPLAAVPQQQEPPQVGQRTPEDDVFLRRLKAMRERHRRNMELLAMEGNLHHVPVKSSAAPSAKMRPVVATTPNGSRAEYISGDSEEERAVPRPPIRSEAEIAAHLEGGDRSLLLSHLDVDLAESTSQQEGDPSGPPPQRTPDDLNTGTPLHTTFPYRFSPTRVPPKLCIPQPFSFERREAAKAKTITQRRMEEDLMQRILEEEALKHRTFKANPVPPSTYLRLLDAKTIEAAKKRGAIRVAMEVQQVRQRSSTPQPRRADPGGQPTAPPMAKPRRRMSLPTHPAVPTEQDDAAEVPAQGDRPLFEDARPATTQSPVGGSAPAADKAPADAETARCSRTSSVQATCGSAAHRPSSLCSRGGRRPVELPKYPFQPQINDDHLPDWKKLWAKYKWHLARVRKERQKTKVEEFHFKRKPRDHEELVLRAMEDMEQDEQTLRERRWPNKMLRTEPPAPAVKTSPPGPEGESVPRATLASKLRNLETLRLLLQKEQQDVLRKREAAERRQHRKEVALRVVPHLPPDPNEGRRLKWAEERVQNRIKHQEQILKYKQQLAETYRRLEQTRPFLFVRGEVERKKQEARETAKQHFREALRQEGLPADQIENIMAEDLDVASDDGLDAVDPLHLFTRPSYGVASAANVDGDLEQTLQTSEELFEELEVAVAAVAAASSDPEDSHTERSHRSTSSRRSSSSQHSRFSSRSSGGSRARSRSPSNHSDA